MTDHIKMLTLFAADLLRMTWDGDVDSFDIEECAKRHGLIVDDTCTQEDVDGGYEADVGDHIYRFSEAFQQAVIEAAKS